MRQAPRFKSSMVRKALVVNNLISEESHTQFAVSSLALSQQQQGKLRAHPYGAHGGLRQCASLQQIPIYTSKLQDYNSTVKFPLQDKNCCRGHCLEALSFLVDSTKPKDAPALKIPGCLSTCLHAPTSSALFAGLFVQMCAAIGCPNAHVQVVIVPSPTYIVS